MNIERGCVRVSDYVLIVKLEQIYVIKNSRTEDYTGAYREFASG